MKRDAIHLIIGRSYNEAVIPAELAHILESTPDVLSGAVRFRGTRIHAKILFDYVLAGDSLDEFLSNYPEIRKQDAQAVLDWERKRVSEDLGLERAS